jgi:hypothetical protein
MNNLDKETRAALLLFNERLAADEAAARAERAVKKAERVKEDAAKALKRLSGSGAAADEVAAADAAYRTALETYQRRVNGEPDPVAEAPVAEEAAATEEPVAEEADASADGEDS